MTDRNPFDTLREDPVVDPARVLVSREEEDAARARFARPKTLDRVFVVCVTNGDDELIGRVGTVTNTFGGFFTVVLDPGPYAFTFKAAELRVIR